MRREYGLFLRLPGETHLRARCVVFIFDVGASYLPLQTVSSFSVSSPHDPFVSFLLAPLSAAITPIRRTVDRRTARRSAAKSKHWRQVRRYKARERIHLVRTRNNYAAISEITREITLAKRGICRKSSRTYLDHVGISRENHGVIFDGNKAPTGNIWQFESHPRFSPSTKMDRNGVR